MTIDYERIFTPAAVAGVVGAIISLQFVEHMNTRQKMLAVISGAALAEFSAVSIAELLQVPAHSNFVAVLIGLFGISAIGWMFAFIKAFDGKMLWKALADRIRGGQGGV